MDKRTPRVPGAGDTPAAQPARAPYATPKLRIYGAVTAMTQNNPGPNNGDVMNMMTTPATPPPPVMSTSERALKHNIVRVGTHPLGVGLYLFEYKPGYHARFGAERHLGVMADEVEAVLPEAITVHPEGFRMVDYGMLGLRNLH